MFPCQFWSRLWSFELVPRVALCVPSAFQCCRMGVKTLSLFVSMSRSMCHSLDSAGLAADASPPCSEQVHLLVVWMGIKSRIFDHAYIKLNLSVLQK